jgi:hypothetical protein
MSTLDVSTRPTCRTVSRRPIPPALVALVVLLLASVALAGCAFRFGSDDPIAQVQLDPAGAAEPEPPSAPPTWVGREEVVAILAESVAEGRLALDLDAAPESCVALLGVLGLVNDYSWLAATASGGELAAKARDLLDQRLAFVPTELHPELEWYADEHLALYTSYEATLEAAGGTDALDEVHVEASRQYHALAETLRSGMPDFMPLATGWSNLRCFGEG